MRGAGLLLLLAGCDRLFGLFPVHEVEPLETTSIDAPPPTACPAEYTITLGSSASRYRVEMLKIDSWVKAANACQSESKTSGSYTHLIVISNEAELADLAAMYRPPIDPTDGKWWVGYFDYVVEDQFEWVTEEDTHGFPMPAAWEPGNPDVSGWGCGNYRDNGLLGDSECDRTYGWICECDGYRDLLRPNR